MIVLALNSGSSSLKFGLYGMRDSSMGVLFSGEAESIGQSNAKMSARNSKGKVVLSTVMEIPSQQIAIVNIGKAVNDAKMPLPTAVGHRVVHGGPELRQHCLIDDNVVRKLEDAAPFAPLHIPSALSAIRFARLHFPKCQQVACFDTTFHAEMPDVASILPIPKELRKEGICRYGFHGLSCESIVEQLGSDLPERLIVAHLGNGASITAIKNGKSIDTSMGLTPTGGVIMGTRSGDLDPGILVYLMREKGLGAAALEEIINHRSGLLGISGADSDMRRLHEASSSDNDVRLAIQMFCYSVRKQVAAMIAVLGGVDMIVFTGGIGENDKEVRASVCGGLNWAGISLDEPQQRSDQHEGSNGGCLVRVLPSQENEQIARHTRSVINESPRL